MKKIKVGLIGLGTVGREVYKILSSPKLHFKSKLEFAIEVKKICDKDTGKLPSELKKSSKFVENANDILDDPEIDIVVELIGGTSPAKEYIVRALENGKHVVTANKALLAEELKLFEVARKNNRLIKFEASVGGGIPVIRTIQEGLVADEILNLYGIVNGTSNYILSNMEEEKYSFKDALTQAQRRGYAEQKADLDVEGIDSVHKLTILANLCFGIDLKPNDIYCEGISHIQYSDIQYAKEAGYKIKLLAIAKKIDNELELRVHPTLIVEDHLLASVKGVNNAIYIESELAGKTLLFGQGAGGKPAGSSVVSDIMDISSAINHGGRDIKDTLNIKDSGLKLKNIKQIFTRYYIRFMAIDKPGVLAKISNILGKHNISISSVIQKERKKARVVPIVMMTHEARESEFQSAIERIKKLDIVRATPVVIRVESEERG